MGGHGTYVLALIRQALLRRICCTKSAAFGSSRMPLRLWVWLSCTSVLLSWTVGQKVVPIPRERKLSYQQFQAYSRSGDTRCLFWPSCAACDSTSKPVIITDWMSDWPASKWTRRYIRERCGENRLPPSFEQVKRFERNSQEWGSLRSVDVLKAFSIIAHVYSIFHYHDITPDVGLWEYLTCIGLSACTATCYQLFYCHLQRFLQDGILTVGDLLDAQAPGPHMAMNTHCRHMCRYSLIM